MKNAIQSIDLATLDTVLGGCGACGGNCQKGAAPGGGGGSPGGEGDEGAGFQGPGAQKKGSTGARPNPGRM